MLSKRQILDVCNRLFQADKNRYLITPKKGDQFNATLMSNDVIFQLAIETEDYETVLRGVHTWWEESSFNPANKKFKT